MGLYKGGNDWGCGRSFGLGGCIWFGEYVAAGRVAFTLVHQGANTVPTRPGTLLELLFGGAAVRPDHESGDVIENRGLGVVDAAGGDGGTDGSHGVLHGGRRKTWLEKGLDFALQVVVAGGTRTHGAVVVAESVVVGMSGLGATASLKVRQQRGAAGESVRFEDIWCLTY